MKDKKQKIEYDLIKLTPEELIDARFSKDKIEIDLTNAKGKLEIQKFKIDHDIAQLELKEDMRSTEKSIEEIKISRDDLDKDNENYEELFLRHNYDILCGEKELKLVKLKIEKRMGSRASNEAIRMLEGTVKLCEDNFKVFADQIRNGVRKEIKELDHVQLDEGQLDEGAKTDE